MSLYPAGTLTTNGVEVPVHVDDNGQWRAEYAGQSLLADSKDKLKGKLDRLTKKTKASVEIHVIRIQEKQSWAEPGILVNEAVLTGIHSANGNVLAKHKIGGRWQSEQLSGWSRDGIYVGGDTSREELEEYGRLIRVRAETRKAIDEWEKAHVLKPKEVVERALKAVTGGDES
jgi:hypothetical protein